MFNENYSQPAAFQEEEYSGVVENITYQNTDNGYTVAQLALEKSSQNITFVGNFPGLNIGETLKLRGTWTKHSKYGRQFEVKSYELKLPSTLEGIKKYLGSGLIPDIGPSTAESIVMYFGEDTLEILDTQPKRLKEVPGIGKKRTARIIAAWQEQRDIKDIMIFLQSHGASTNLAVKLYKTYGHETVQVIKNNPYQMAKDIFGVGFKTADQIALKLGLEKDSPFRIRAALAHILDQESSEGHCFAEEGDLLQKTTKLLNVPEPACQTQLDTLDFSRELIRVDGAVYLPYLYEIEKSTASHIRRISSTLLDCLERLKKVDFNQEFFELDFSNNIQLTDQQRKAIVMSLTNRFSILTGGPGTGKSTIVNSIIKLLDKYQGSVKLAAPTGRAAKRLIETTGIEAKTIHRLLEYSPSEGYQFQKNEDSPLKTDMIIVDEASMMDILLSNSLLSAIPDGTHVLLVGDVDQLPSVGPGNVLKDIIASDSVPVTRLDTIFRQAEDSFIIVNAHRINKGELPEFPKEASDFFLFPVEEPEKAALWVQDIVMRRIKTKFGFDPEKDIQVLSPMHRGACGVKELNRILQEQLNPFSPFQGEYQHGFRKFRKGDRIMQIRNNYEKQVFNGDIGYIKSLDAEEQTLILEFDERIVSYEYNEMDEIVHAYAISIHKSQGSEFPVVVIPLLTQHYMMLQRNLLYTAITRARKLVVLVGSKKAIAMAVKNNRPALRNTRLEFYLAETTSGE